MPVHGAGKLRKLARDLREAGATDLRKELAAGIDRPVKPFIAAVRSQIPAVMPSGYAPVLGRSMRIRTSTRTRGAGAGVSLVGQAKGKAELRDLPALDAGRLRHKAWGRPRPWYTQAIPPGFWTRPADKLIDDIRREVEKAVDEVADKLERG